MAARKPLVHRKKTCMGEYQVLYTEDNFPYLRCENCGYELKDWIKWNQEYKSYHEDENKWSSKKDHMMCLLGYFCFLYKKHFGEEFSLSLDEKGLFNGAEHSILRRIYNNFAGDASQVKEYLDWYFETKIEKKKKTIRSISFLAVPDALNEFRQNRKKQAIITRDRPIHPKMLEWISQFAPKVYDAVSLSDYGDLHTLLSAYRQGHFRTTDMTLFVEKLNTIGLIDGDYNIKNWRD